MHVHGCSQLELHEKCTRQGGLDGPIYAPNLALHRSVCMHTAYQLLPSVFSV